MIFEDLPTTPRAEELLDQAFSRAARAGRAKGGREAQESMLRTAGNVASDNLENVVASWPDFDRVDPFYRELADAVVDVDALREALSSVGWAARRVGELRDDYAGRIRGTDPETARKHRKQAFARMADVVDEVADDLELIDDARGALRDLPDLRPDEPALAVAGYPNVGKSSFVNRVTRASGEVASYPFTTTTIGVGHFEHDYVRYQVIDTPGLLDRPPAEHNDVERRALAALEHLADAVLFLVDASGECGYPVEAQLDLRDRIRDRFAPRGIPVLTVCNKADRSRDVTADASMSVTEGENVDAVLEMAVGAVAHEPDLPTRDG